MYTTTTSTHTLLHWREAALSTWYIVNFSFKGFSLLALWAGVILTVKSYSGSLKFCYHLRKDGADCASDHELLIAKFRLKLKKEWKTTRPFRYYLNQIPHNYIVEVTNRFKGLDLIDRVPEKLWIEVCNIVQQWSRPSPRKRSAKRQNDCLSRPYK